MEDGNDANRQPQLPVVEEAAAREDGSDADSGLGGAESPVMARRPRRDQEEESGGDGNPPPQQGKGLYKYIH